MVPSGVLHVLAQLPENITHLGKYSTLGAVQWPQEAPSQLNFARINQPGSTIDQLKHCRDWCNMEKIAQGRGLEPNNYSTRLHHVLY